ncbi:hypothetical protein D9M72_307280 [compost metagenome]
MMKVHAVSRQRILALHGPAYHHGQQINQHEAEDPQHHDRGHMFAIVVLRLGQLYGKPHDAEAQHQAARVAEKDALPAPKWILHIEQEESRECARQDHANPLRREVAYLAGQVGEPTENHERQATAKPIKAVAHIHRIDHRHCGE